MDWRTGKDSGGEPQGEGEGPSKLLGARGMQSGDTTRMGDKGKVLHPVGVYISDIPSAGDHVSDPSRECRKPCSFKVHFHSFKNNQKAQK